MSVLSVASDGLARSVVVSGTGGPSLSFSVPAGVTFQLEGVYADVDVTAAGADVTALLTIAEQSGVIIQKKAQGSKITAGAAGSASWGLRLADDAVATTPVGPADFEEFIDAVGVVVPTATSKRLVWVPTAGVPLLTPFPSDTPTVNATGIYALSIEALPLSNPGFLYSLVMAYLDVVNATPVSFSSASPAGTTLPSLGAMIPRTRGYQAADSFRVTVQHDAGVNVTIGLRATVQRLA